MSIQKKSDFKSKHDGSKLRYTCSKCSNRPYTWRSVLHQRMHNRRPNKMPGDWPDIRDCGLLPPREPNPENDILM